VRSVLAPEQRVNPSAFENEGGNMKNLVSITLGIALALGSSAAVWAAAPPSTTATAQESSDQPGTDTWITTKVKAELMTTKDIPSTEISVTTTNGIVMLAGVVDTKAQVEKSIAVAKAVKGVQKVDSSALKSRN
jgi:hyperosmotically inducible periplasmic protein